MRKRGTYLESWYSLGENNKIMKNEISKIPDNKWWRSGKELFTVNDKRFPLPSGQQPEKIVRISFAQLVDDPTMLRMNEEDYEDLVASILHEGMCKPILVRPCEKSKKYHIIIGHNRCRALHQLGYKTAECIIWDKPVSCDGKIPISKSGHNCRE